MMGISNTKKANIDRAIRQLERGFKILADNDCSVFFEGEAVYIFATKELPYDGKSVDGSKAVESIAPACDHDAGGW